MNNSFPDDRFLARWLDGTLNEEEKKHLRQEMDEEQFALWLKRFSELKAPGFSEEATWEKFKTRREELTPKRADLRPKLVRRFSIAASILMLIIATGIFFSKLKKEQTALNQEKSLTLPDASIVLLKSQSSLNFRSNLWPFRRVVTLKGEAFFNVKEGSEFIVKTNQGLVKVLGTSFDVISRDSVFAVFCHSGRVLVSKGIEEAVLEPNQKVESWGGNALTKSTLADSIKTIRFNKEPIENVFQKMEEIFNVKINFLVKSEVLYSGGFSNEALEKALIIVCNPLGFSYKIEQNEVSITHANTEGD